MKFGVFVASEEQEKVGCWVQEEKFILTDGKSFRAHALELYRKYHEMWDVSTLAVQFEFAGRTIASVTVTDGLCLKFEMNSFIDLRVTEDGGRERLLLQVMDTVCYGEFNEIAVYYEKSMI